MSNEVFSKPCYAILNYLNQNDIKNKINAVSTQTIANSIDYSKVTINNSAKILINEELISYGLKGRAYTYYITQNGINKLKEFEEE